MSRSPLRTDDMTNGYQELWNPVISRFVWEKKWQYVQRKATWKKTEGEKVSLMVWAKWAFIKDMSKCIIVILIAVHSQKKIVCLLGSIMNTC